MATRKVKFKQIKLQKTNPEDFLGYPKLAKPEKEFWVHLREVRDNIVRISARNATEAKQKVVATFNKDPNDLNIDMSDLTISVKIAK